MRWSAIRTTSRSSSTSGVDDGNRETWLDGGAVLCSTEQTQLGEGIRWDARRDELLGVDIVAGRVYRGRVRDDGSLERVRVYQLPGTVGMIAPVEGDDGWLLGAGRSFVHLAPDGTHRVIAEVAPAATRMNDGACDPQGRFGAGPWPMITTPEAVLSTGWIGTGGADGARRPDDLQRTGLEPRRRHDVPGGQRPAGHPRVCVRRRPGHDPLRDGSWSRCPRTSAHPMG